MNAKLLIIHEENVHGQIVELLGDLEAESYWIGLISHATFHSDIGKYNYKWFWSDFSELNFRKWATNPEKRAKEAAMRAIMDNHGH